MKNVSSAFREELKKDNRNYIKSADITLKSGTVLKVDNSDLWQNGMKLDTATSNPNSFDLGAIITGQLTLTLKNIDEKFSDYDFTDCTATNVKVGLKLPDGTTESLSYGKFYLNEAKYNGSIITLTFYDSIYKFDRPYSKSSLSYPATLRQIVQDACSVCGVTLGTVTFDQEDFVVQERPDDSSITFRQVLQWVGQIACYYFYADSQGRLSMKWYDLSAFEDADNIFLKDSDGNFVLDAQEDKIFTFVENGTIYPGTTMPHHNIASFVSLNTGLDDVVITGIKVIQEVDGESGGKEEISYQSGNDGYVLAVSKNKLIQGDSGNTIASLLGTKIIGMRFRTFSASGLSDPTIEAGDPVVLIDRKGNSYQSYITNNVFQPGAYQSTSLGAETPARKSATRYSQMSQVYVDYRKEIEKERTDREKALEELGERINDSSGLFTTIEEQPDGSKKYFLHNKPILSESDIVWSMTAEAWGVSTDGGKTQNAGMTVDGDTIVRILTAVGVNADWIKTGALRIEKNGQVMLNADIDTGQVDIVANSFSLRGRSIDEIAEQQLSDFVDAVYDPTISNLQSQIDGQIETWFYDYLPTIENAPANSWTTDSEKDKHLGDLFYIVDNEEYGGQAYRWAKIGTEYKWDYVEDTATVKALADAAKAQDTADQKRRVFISTPMPPYDEGDLWMQGDNGDIMTCVNSRQSGNYVSSDWEKRNKYTDDTAVKKLDDSLDQTDIFNRLTNNGSVQGIYLQGQKIYINGSYIQTGIISVKNPSGKETFYVNVDTGDVRINAKSFSLYDGTTLSSVLQDSKDYTDNKIRDIDPTDNLTQSEIFNILTNNGQTQGIYLSGGKIYINASYISSGNLTANRIKGGTLTLGGSGNTNGILKILNSRGAQIGLWDNSGISASNAEVNGSFSASDGTRKISISGGEISLYHKNKQCAAINPARYNSDDNQLGLDIQSIGKYLTLTLGDIIHLTIGKVVYGGDGLTYTNTWYGANLFRGRIKLINSFSCTGTKSRVVKTKNYGNRLQYCYEMASPYFGDIGTSITDEFGESYISIDDIFSETASCNVEYQVFLQKEGMGDIWVEKKELTYFLVKGTPNLKFSWEIKVKQKDFEYERLDSEAFIEEDEENSVEKILTDEIEKYSENQEDLLWSIN